MQDQNDESQKPDQEEQFVPLRARYMTFMEAAPGKIMGTQKLPEGDKQVEMNLTLLALSEGRDVEHLGLNTQDMGNMICEAVIVMAHQGYEWARRVAGALALINREMAEEQGMDVPEDGDD